MSYIVSNRQLLYRLSLHEFKYTGRRQIAGVSNGARNGICSNTSGSIKSTTKAMTLPARMQPPDFSGDSPIIPHNVLSGSNSVGRENMAHRGTENLT